MGQGERIRHQGPRSRARRSRREIPGGGGGVIAPVGHSFPLAPFARLGRSESTPVAPATFVAGATVVTADQVKPTFRTKCPRRRFMTPPPAQCTMNARRMMASIATTSQKKKTTIPGIEYPATDLTLATGPSYPGWYDLFQDVMEGGTCGRY